MKHWLQGILVALALTLGGPVFAGQTYSLGVDGLACPFCAYGIEKQMYALRGVKDVVVDLNTGTVRVAMQGGATLSKAQLKQAVKDAGFALKSMKTINN